MESMNELGLIVASSDIQQGRSQSSSTEATVFFDGSCPLCRAEIRYYRTKNKAGELCFIDVSESGAVMPESLTRQQVMARFHVRAGDGRVLSGAAAFVEVWTRLSADGIREPGALTPLGRIGEDFVTRRQRDFDRGEIGVQFLGQNLGQ